MRGIEPRAFHMQSERSTTELHPLLSYTTIYLESDSEKNICPRWGSNSRPSDYETDALPTALRRLLGQKEIISRADKKNIVLPTGGLEPPIFGLGDRRLIH